MTGSRRGLVVALSLLIATAIVFALWPNIDLAVSRLFFREGEGFLWRGGLWSAARSLFNDAPFVFLIVVSGLYVCRRYGVAVNCAPSGRALVFLLATFIIGPGLVVNLGLKDHAHRPRPTQTREFGGPYEFRPWYRFDGGCKKNCSFVSGEASQGFWMLAPASLTPPPLRLFAIGGALLFGAAAGLLRVAAGGHYLSDIIFAALIIIIIVQGARWLMFRPDEDAL